MSPLVATSTVLWVVAVAVEGAALMAVTTLWLVARRRQRVLRAEVRRLREAGSGDPRPRGGVRRLVPRPDETVKAIWETASLVREKGVGGAIRTSINDLAGWAQVERPDLVRLAGADGRVAILFSDIESSTALNEEVGDQAWVRLLRKHDEVVRARVERHGGHVVKTQGDGFMVAFSEPGEAVRCAVDVQRAFDRRRRRGRRSLLLRIGVHHGDVVHRDNDIFGRNVAHAARVAALAEGGQVLVSRAVAEALADQDDVVLGEERLVELKGLTGEHLVVEVEWRDDVAAGPQGAPQGQ
ncbi:adenylate/guanylate cyclase domain-containing protein [Nocardioides sp. SYSU D00038]|uniref:adenylate/guanylate cyclase domain-containing protein n=1 Tax=Nocardioides sp. SYSU D00038 TaxID=2812554 RepID=UPI0027DD6939|nr:adenylate/guanylate cyclase domain-containing protein [Nocardioides sp. SYSU D00038]